MPGYFSICDPEVIEAPAGCGCSSFSGGVVLTGPKGDKGDPGDGNSCCPANGNGSPEGIVAGPEGKVYVDDLTRDVYIKVIGDDAYGWVIFTGATSPSVGIYKVGTIAQARLIPRNITNLMLDVNGDMTGGDGLNHLHYDWDQASTAPNNNGSVLDPLLPGPGVGRWIQN